MTIHIRNVRTPSGATGYFLRWIPWLWREVLLIGRWTEVANNGDAAWASNVLNTYTDLSVSPSEPCIVRSVAGSFDSSQVGKLLSLFDPTNDANCILARIMAVPSATMLALDGICFAKPWVTASGLTGRVHAAGQTSYLTGGAWTVLQSPGAAPYQVRFVATSGTAATIQAYPKCDYATTGYLTAAINYSVVSNEWTVRMNADIEENNFNQYFFSDRSTPWVRYCISGGSLTDTAVGDTWANFIAASALVQSQTWLYHPWSSAAWCGPMKMIGYSNEQTDAYAEAPKRFSDDSVNTYGLWSGNFDVFKKWCNNKIVIGYPRVVMADVASGGYVRGKLPWPIVNWKDWPDFSTIGSAANWRKSEGCLLMPHGGLAGCDRFPALWEF